jgi:glycerophosphoryl diester phosphodiesterase
VTGELQRCAPKPRVALREATRRVLGDPKGHLGYGVLASVAGGVILTPAGSWLLMKIITTGGGSAVNTAIASFVFSLRGLVVLALWSMLVGVVIVITAAGQAHLAGAAALGRRPTLREVIRMVGADLVRVPGLGGAKIAILAALGTPVLGSLVTAVTTLLLTPIRGLEDLRNVVPRGLPVPLWMVGAGMAVLAVIFSWLYVRWSLAIPALALEGVSLNEGVRRSVRRVRGSFWRIGVAHLAHHVTIALLFALLVFLLRLGGRPLLEALFEKSESHGLVGVLVLLVLFSAAAGTLGILAIARLVALTVVHHAALGGGLERADAIPAGLARRLRAGRALLLVSAAIAFAVTLWVMLPRVREELKRATHGTAVSAHRGGAFDAPENTMAALKNAVETRADSFEIDVQQAKDGTLVVVHDPNLKRLAGVDVDVGTLTWPELAKLDVGSHFSPAFREERIPTLEQVLDAARDRVGLTIEIKTNGYENEAFVADFIALLRRKDALSRCAVMSLESRFLAAVRKLEPGIKLGVIITAKVGTASDLDVDFYAVQPLMATSDFIRTAHREGREVWVWTVNDRTDMARFTDRAADVIITDSPGLAREVLEARTPKDGIRAAVRRLFGLD